MELLNPVMSRIAVAVFAKVTAELVPKADVDPALSVPELTVVAPLYELVPDNDNVPPLNWVSVIPPVPDILPLKV